MKKAELTFCAFIAEHNLPFRVMDHLSTVISRTFKDSAIASEFSCKRTKTAAMTYNVLAREFKTQLRTRLLGEDGKATPVSLIIDETTDKGTAKCMAIVIKLFNEASKRVDTRLLNLVPVQEETAAALFELLKTDLAKHDVQVTQLIGFAADTTNVIFGEHNSVASRIKEENPNCLAIKCACHSCALAVSHACSLLPRNLEQVIKECYNYFALSSKRCLEFKEFQEFSESKQYRMLRFYDIRWLSFGACVERLLNQWNALKLYFTSQYSVDRLQASQFLFEQLSDPITKLYFAFLNYILSLVNKLNVIFQSEAPIIHKFHANCTLAYTSILSCFVKPVLLKGNVTEIDVRNPANHLPLNQLYMGTDAARLLVSDAYKNVKKEMIGACFHRCQQFLVELCSQLKKRLPLNHPLVRQLSFLNPQLAISGTIASIADVAAEFPQVIPIENLQSLDQEWRQMSFDEEISELADQCAALPTEEFWANVALNEKYQVVGRFAKAMLCLPISNADSERVFSQLNLIKTKQRNRFSTEGVASLIFVKEGIKGMSGSCENFQPTEEMLGRCSKEIYTNVEAIYGDRDEESNNDDDDE